MQTVSPGRVLFALIMLSTLATPIASQVEWPGYAGPRHDRTVGVAIAQRNWPDRGPAIAWKVKTSLGFSSFAIGSGSAITLVDREGRETCLALSTTTGEELWATSVGSAKYDEGAGPGDGPRSTPSLDGERVYVLDSKLILHCLRLKSGEAVWKRDLMEEHKGRNIYWQNSASPVIDGDAVFVGGGGPGQSLIAFDKESGEVLWKDHDETITHATPIVATIHGVRQVIFFVQSGLLSVRPKTGAVLWRVKFPFRTSTAASPVVAGDVVYCSAGYGVGAGAYRIERQRNGKFTSKELWRKRNRLINHWSTPVLKDGHLYGMFSFKKYGKGPLQCVDLATGEVRWSQSGYGPGNCILVGDDLVALSDRGEVVLVEAISEAYKEVARADILSGTCWSSPAFAGGQLYVRSTKEGACLDLAKVPTKKRG